MIYLFDDKESRQQSYGWTNKMFELWSDFIVRIKDYSDYLLLEEKDVLKFEAVNHGIKIELFGKKRLNLSLRAISFSSSKL